MKISCLKAFKFNDFSDEMEQGIRLHFIKN